MTEAQGDQVILLLEHIEFLVQVLSICASFAVAGMSWRLIRLTSNEGRFW